MIPIQVVQDLLSDVIKTANEAAVESDNETLETDKAYFTGLHAGMLVMKIRLQDIVKKYV